MGIKNCYYNVYSDNNSRRTKLNPWRLLQFIVACACFIVTIFLVNSVDVSIDVPNSTFYVSIAASSIICILTFLDLIGMLYGSAFHWSTWLLIVTVCIVLSILCVAVLVLHLLMNLIVLIALALFLILTIIFIIDLICLSCFITHRRSERRSISNDDNNSILPTRKRNSVTNAESRTYTEVGTSMEIDAMQSSTLVKNDEPDEPLRKSSSVVSSNRTKNSSQGSSNVTKTTSYGGTFPMSKTELPLPSPCANRHCREKPAMSTTSVQDKTEKSHSTVSARSQSHKDMNALTPPTSAKRRCACPSRFEPASPRSGSKSEAVLQKGGSRSEGVSPKSGSRGDVVSQRSGSRSETVTPKSGSRGEVVSQRSGSRSEAFTPKSGSRGEVVSQRSGSRSETITPKSGSRGEVVAHRSGSSKIETLSHKSASKSDAVSQKSDSPSRSPIQKTHASSRHSSTSTRVPAAGPTLIVKDSTTETCDCSLESGPSPQRTSKISQLSFVGETRRSIEKQPELSPRSQSARSVIRSSYASRNGLDYTGSERIHSSCGGSERIHSSGGAIKSDEETEKELEATVSSRTINLSDNNNNWNRERDQSQVSATSRPFSSHVSSATSAKEFSKRDVKSAGSTQYQQQQYYPPQFQQGPIGYSQSFPPCAPCCPQYVNRPQNENSNVPPYVVTSGPVYCHGPCYGKPETSSKPTQVSPSTRTVSVSKSRSSVTSTVASSESARSIYEPQAEKNLEIHRTGCSCCDCRPDEDLAVDEDEPVDEEPKQQKSLSIYHDAEERSNTYYLQSEVLESISEVDCETDSSNLRPSRSSSEECYCPERPELSSDEVQTSETRIITAKDLEQLNLPGTVFEPS